MMLFRIPVVWQLPFLTSVQIEVWRTHFFYGFREAGRAIKSFAVSCVWVFKRPHRENSVKTPVCIPSRLYGVNYPKYTIRAFVPLHELCGSATPSRAILTPLFFFLLAWKNIVNWISNFIFVKTKYAWLFNYIGVHVADCKLQWC